MTNIRKLSVALLSIPFLSLTQMCGCGVCTVIANDKVPHQIIFQKNENPKTAEIKITGMSCAGCATHIHTALSKTEGVISDKVKYPGNIAIIKYNPFKISEDQIVKVIEKAGYKAEVQKEKKVNKSQS